MHISSNLPALLAFKGIVEDVVIVSDVEVTADDCGGGSMWLTISGWIDCCCSSENTLLSVVVKATDFC